MHRIRPNGNFFRPRISPTPAPQTRGAQQNLQKKLWNTLAIASTEEFVRTINDLCDSGADINDNVGGDAKKYTFLTVLCDYTADTDRVDAVLKKGADVTRCSYYGRNPLEKAINLLAKEVLKGNPQPNLGVCQLLLQNGADPNFKNYNGDTYLMDLIKGPSPFNNLYSKITIEDQCRLTAKLLPLAKLLLEKGADPNLQDNTGSTPFLILIKSLLFLTDIFLKEIAENVWIPLIKLLLEAGADPTIPNSEGQTIKEIAHDHFSSEVRLLLEKVIIDHAKKIVCTREEAIKKALQPHLIKDLLPLMGYLDAEPTDYESACFIIKQHLQNDEGPATL